MTARGAAPPGIALGVLFLARVVYAFNWYDIGAVLPFVPSSFGIGTARAGIVLASFLIGAGIFQLPAGFAAMRWGNRRTAIGALAAMSACTLASAVSPTWQLLALARFGAGAGAAFFFAPALGLATSYYPAGTRGPVIGIYNAGFSVGSGVGLFAGAIVGSLYGWSWALAVGGFLLLAGTAAAALLLPRDRAGGPPAMGPHLWRRGFAVLRSRALWALALGTSGLWAAFYVAAQYFVEYSSQSHLGWSVPLAATIPTVMIAAEVPGGPIGGWFAERRGRLRTILVVSGILAGVGVALVPFYSLAAAWGVFVVLGFADGVVFAVLYLIPTYFPDLTGTEFSLGLALLNSIQIFVGSALALGFAFVADRAGFPLAWLVAGAVGAGLLPFLYWVPPAPRPASPRAPTAEPASPTGSF